MAMVDDDKVKKYCELRTAIRQQRERGLYQSAKWAAQLILGLPQEVIQHCDSTAPHEQGEREPPDSAAHELAKTYFDVKEYRRCAHALPEPTNAKSLFLKCYALYLAGEKRKEEERVESAGPLGKGTAVNKELDGIETQLRAAHEAGCEDGYTLYLLGLVHTSREKKDEAVETLVASVAACPCNWGAWQALQVLCDDADMVSQLSLPQHWMRDFFLATLCLELSHNAEALSRLHSLTLMFPNCDFIVYQAGAVHYQMRNFDEAQVLFEDVLQRDPYRLEGMDSYSNVLFVKEQFAALSHLAHNAALTDKYRPETCCIIGNYYSLKGEHVKAVEYFRRALRLNPSFLSAWTLMGHEYIEIKNPSAAVDAYRQAIDISPRDYRAWYGLGQVYELLGMKHYALYYYRQATQLRSSDSRMWCAMGNCYESEEVGADQAAIRCYNRALAHNDREGLAMGRLASLYQKHGHAEMAALYYDMNLQRIDAENGKGQDAAQALAFLASHYKDQGQLADAEALSLRLMDYGGQYTEQAKSLLREIRNLAKHQAKNQYGGIAGTPLGRQGM